VCSRDKNGIRAAQLTVSDIDSVEEEVAFDAEQFGRNAWSLDDMHPLRRRPLARYIYLLTRAWRRERMLDRIPRLRVDDAGGTEPKGEEDACKAQITARSPKHVALSMQPTGVEVSRRGSETSMADLKAESRELSFLLLV